MDEYIERKKVLSKAAPVAGCFSDMISVYDVIMLPAADVSPVRHGQWELTGADKYGRGGIWKCTGRDGCGKFYPYKCDFCPNCGAKMDGSVSE